MILPPVYFGRIGIVSPRQNWPDLSVGASVGRYQDNIPPDNIPPGQNPLQKSLKKLVTRELIFEGLGVQMKPRRLLAKIMVDKYALETLNLQSCLQL